MVNIKILSYLPSIDVIIYKKNRNVHELFGQPSYMAEFRQDSIWWNRWNIRINDSYEFSDPVCISECSWFSFPFETKNEYTCMISETCRLVYAKFWVIKNHTSLISCRVRISVRFVNFKLRTNNGYDFSSSCVFQFQANMWKILAYRIVI
jgi:hypothetical protein